MFDLNGTTALVTGATGGLGEAIARQLHAQGAHVILSGTRVAVLDALAASLAERVTVAPCNLSDAQAVEALIPGLEDAGHAVDILINNAGLTRDTLMMRMKDDDWDAVLDTNLKAVFRMSRAVMRPPRVATRAAPPA